MTRLNSALVCVAKTVRLRLFWPGLLLAAAMPRALLAQGSGTLGAEFQVNTYVTNSQSDPAVAIDASGNFVVAWQSRYQDGSFYGIFAQRFNAAGVPQGGEFRVNTYTQSTQILPSVAMDASGNFVVAWNSCCQDGSSTGVFAQRYDAAGTTKGAEFRVNTAVTGFQGYPSVAMNASGDFVVAWQSAYQDGYGDGVFAQRFNAAGVPQGGEFQVNTYTTSTQGYPSAAMDASGNFVIAWQSFDAYGYGVFAQRFDAAGVPRGGEFRVNSYVTNSQTGPSVAMDAGGSFVVAWRSEAQDAGGGGVFAQRFDASGTPQGGEFQVNTYTTGTQTAPSVTADAVGNFVVAWHSYQQDGSNYGVFAQRFNAAGTRIGPEQQVNTYTTSFQNVPSVAMDPSGKFVVSWESEQDGSNEGVFAQRFAQSPSLSIGDAVVMEGNSGTVTASFDVTLSPASNLTVTVAFTTAPGTATGVEDYVPTSGTLTFNPGETTKSIDVAVIGDTADEPTGSGPSEWFFVNLSAAADASISEGQGRGAILNDDAAPAAPSLDPVQEGLITVGATATLTGANFTAGTVIKLFVNTGGSIDDVSGASGFTPTAFSFNTLTWEIPATVPLGQGFGSIFVVNTDQGFTQSNTVYALLYGDPPDNLPTITSIAGRALETTLDPGVPVAHTDTVVTPGLTVAVGGTAFNVPGVNLFGAVDAGADPAPTATPCAVFNYGGIFPGGDATGFAFNLPAMPAGPLNVQVVNDPYSGNVQSNSVSAVAEARPTITSVSMTGDLVSVLGTGFSCLSVINLFNLQGTDVANLGGLTGGGQRVVPLQFVSKSELRFMRPAGAVAGPAFVEVLNPPYIPFSSTGNDPDGAFSFP